MKPSLAPSNCSTPISSRRDWMSNRTVLPTTSSAPMLSASREPALIVDDDSELYAITSGGGVIRTAAKQVRKAGRQTKGVRLMNLAEGDSLLAIARNADEPDDEDKAEAESITEE